MRSYTIFHHWRSVKPKTFSKFNGFYYANENLTVMYSSEIIKIPLFYICGAEKEEIIFFKMLKDCCYTTATTDDLNFHLLDYIECEFANIREDFCVIGNYRTLERVAKNNNFSLSKIEEKHLENKDYGMPSAFWGNASVYESSGCPEDILYIIKDPSTIGVNVRSITDNKIGMMMYKADHIHAINIVRSSEKTIEIVKDPVSAIVFCEDI